MIADGDIFMIMIEGPHVGDIDRHVPWLTSQARA